MSANRETLSGTGRRLASRAGRGVARAQVSRVKNWHKRKARDSNPQPQQWGHALAVRPGEPYPATFRQAVKKGSGVLFGTPNKTPDPFLTAASGGEGNRTQRRLLARHSRHLGTCAPDRNARAVIRARGEGVEPSQPASKAGGLPLADPRRQRVSCGSRTHLAGLEDRDLCRSAKDT